MIEDNLEIITTGDGSQTLYRRDLDEIYHSTHGAIQESKHIFIDSALSAHPPLPLINILEIGFGTGLNAVLTMEYASKHSQPIHYHTIEKHPLPPSITNKLSYGKQLSLESEYTAIHKSPWNKSIELSPYFSIHKTDKAFDDVELEDNRYHIIYFDAFAPEYSPELWTIPVFQHLHNALVAGGILITYCAKGEVQRNLKASGYTVHKLPGPKGKREIVKGVVRC